MNAKQELVKILGNTLKPKCAKISGYISNYKDSDIPTVILKNEYTEEEYTKFLNLLDFEYDNDYGIQELYGIIWLKDGAWLSRYSYDGNEKWVHNKLPEIPLELLKQ